MGKNKPTYLIIPLKLPSMTEFKLVVSKVWNLGVSVAYDDNEKYQYQWKGIGNLIYRNRNFIYHWNGSIHLV